MKTVSLEQFIELKPCWLSEKGGLERLKRTWGEKPELTALDILSMTNVLAEDRLWAVCREEFIDAPILHEFACRCAEEALKLVENPDPRSVAAIEAKRKWLKGKISDAELRVARDVARTAAFPAAFSVARNVAGDAAFSAAFPAAGSAAFSAAMVSASDGAIKPQVKILRELLENDQK